MTLLTVRSRSLVPCIEYRLGFIGITRSACAAARAFTVSTPSEGGVSRKMYVEGGELHQPGASEARL